MTDLLNPPAAELDDHRRELMVRFPATRSGLLLESDAEFLVELLSDPTISWYEPMAVPMSDPMAHGLVLSYIRKASDPRSTILGWLLVENSVKVGVCQLRREHEGFLVGVSLFPWARGRGLGTATFSALADLAYNRLDATHVAGEVEDDNIASIKALEKAMFAPTDRYRTRLDNGRTPIVTRYNAQMPAPVTAGLGSSGVPLVSVAHHDHRQSAAYAHRPYDPYRELAGCEK